MGIKVQLIKEFRNKNRADAAWLVCEHQVSHLLWYDTIAEFNVDSKAEYTA